MATSAIPGLDVIEQFGGPRTQSPAGGWTPGQSPQANTWNMNRNANMGPQRPTGGLRAAGQGLRSAMPALKKMGVAGAGLQLVSDMNDYKIDDPEVDSSAAGTLRSLRAGDFEGTRRSLGKGLLEAGMDVGSSVAKTLDTFVPGDRPVSSRYNTALREIFGDQLIDNSGSYRDPGPGRSAGPGGPLVGSAGSAGAPGSSSSQPGAVTTTSYADRQPFSDARFDAQNRSVPGPQPGNIVRDGNSYSGVGDVKFGADIVDPQGRVIKSGAPDAPGFGVTVVPGLRSAPTAGVPGAGQPAGPTVIGLSGETLSSANRRRFDETPSASILHNDGLSDRQREQFRVAREGQAIQSRGQDLAHALGLRGQDVTSRGQDLAYDSSMYGHNTQRRGQDLAHEVGMVGHETSARNARSMRDTQAMRLQYDMAKDERDYRTGRSDKAFEQKQAREKQLGDMFTTLATTTDSDGKPVVNQARANTMRLGFDRAVARLGANGVHELSPVDEQRLVAATSLMATMQDNAGMLPWQPDKLKTIDPLDLTNLRVLPNGDRQITRPGKAAGQIIPKRFFETEEGTRMGDWLGTGNPTNRYDILSESR